MKRTLAALLAAFTLLALVSCTARGPEEQQTERQTQPQTEESRDPEPTSAQDDEGKTKAFFYSEETWNIRERKASTWSLSRCRKGFRTS